MGRPSTADRTAPDTWRTDFGRLWTAQTIAVFGGEITGVAIPLAWLVGFLSTGLLVAVAFAAGTAGVCFRIGWSSFLPSVVPAENLASANGKLRTSMTVSGLTGVALAGVLVQLVGGPMAVSVNAAGFAL